jgi:hypothetical protein
MLIMSGWLIAITVPGIDAETRPMRELWAVSIENEYDAVAEVAGASGGENPEALTAISGQILAGLGLTDAGKAAHVKSVF